MQVFVTYLIPFAFLNVIRVASLSPIDAKLAQVEEFQPISQLIYGSRGCYTQTNIESRKRYTVDAFRTLAHSIEHRRPPPHQERGSESSRNRTNAITQRVTRRRQTRSRRHIRPPELNEEEEEEVDNNIENGDDNEDDEYYDEHDEHEEHEEEEDEDEENEEIVKKRKKKDRKSTRVTRSQRVLRSSQSAGVATSISPPVSPKQLDNGKNRDSDEQGEQSESEEPMEEFSFERCQELERDYWRNLTYNPPYYGADIPGRIIIVL
jgi:hypothetical protein